MSELHNALSKRLEIEQSITALENQINDKKRQHAELETNLSEHEKSVRSSLQVLDHMEQLKVEKIRQLSEADKQLSDTQKKTLEQIKQRQQKQRDRGRKINSLIKQLRQAYTELLTESSDIDASGFRQSFPNSGNSIDLQREHQDRNPHTWLMQLPAYLESNTPQLILMSVSEVEDRNQKVL